MPVVRFFLRRLIWLLVAPVIAAVPLAWLLTPVFVPRDHNRPLDYLAVWLYGVVVVGVGIALCYRGDSLLDRLPARWPAQLGWLGTPTLGQPRAAWLLAAPAVALTATLLVGQLNLSAQHAIWLRLAIDAPGATAPAVRLHFGPAAADAVAVSWQPYDESIVAVRPLDAQAEPPRILALATDQGPVARDRLTIMGGRLTRESVVVTSTTGLLMTWPQPSRALTLTLAAGQGAVAVSWLDQHARVSLGPQPAQVSFSLPAAWQGWALLPPREVRQLALELPSSGGAYHIRRVDILGAAPQSWGDRATMAGWTAQGCTALPEDAGLFVQPAATRPCLLEVPGVRVVNAANRGVEILAWGALTAALLGLLWLLPVLVRGLRRWNAGYQVTETAFGRWLNRCARGWSVGGALWGVWSAALAFHLVYALTVPIHYGSDTVEYYMFGRALATTQHFISTSSMRTPGYPAIIAVLISLFGDTVIWIVVVQHLALAALAPLAVWALARHVPLPVATLAGVLVGLAPAIAALANLVHTESLFAAGAVATLLVYIGNGERLRGLLVTGMLAGATVIVRPTGLILVVILGGWLLLRGWCDPGRGLQQRKALAGGVAFLAGYLALAAPWHIYLGLVLGTNDLSGGLAGRTAWFAAGYQQRLDSRLAVTLPDRAVWMVPLAWDSNPYALVERFPRLVTVQSDQPYYIEALRQAAQIDPAALRNNQLSALIYNLTFKRRDNDGDYMYWTEVSGLLNLFEMKIQPSQDLSGHDSIKPLLSTLVARRTALQSPVLLAFIGLGRFVLQQWIWLALLNLLCVGLVIRHPRLRIFMPCWLFWIGLVMSTSAIGMPVERYIVVVEPLLYVILVTALFVFLCLRCVNLPHQADHEPHRALKYPQVDDLDSIISTASIRGQTVGVDPHDHQRSLPGAQ